MNSHALLSACVAVGVENFIFSSTAAVYGMPAEQPIAESAATQPINPYGASKLMTEMMLRDTAAAHGLHYVVLRYFNVAGADQAGRTGERRPVATHLINVATQVALGRRASIDIFGADYDTPDGTCIRDYIHVSDLADAHVKAVEHLERGGASLTANCGYGWRRLGARGAGSGRDGGRPQARDPLGAAPAGRSTAPWSPPPISSAAPSAGNPATTISASSSGPRSIGAAAELSRGFRNRKRSVRKMHCSFGLFGIGSLFRSRNRVRGVPWKPAIPIAARYGGRSLSHPRLVLVSLIIVKQIPLNAWPCPHVRVAD
ncbi:MAG: NAD-dependent epimerase/dehydratase family protein [Aliidongia sp.]